MLTLKYLLSTGEKVGIKQLTKILTAGFLECETEVQKKEFGLQVMSVYDHKDDEEMKEFLKHGYQQKYYNNLIHQDDDTLIKNIVWNPKVETPIHGHNCQGCWVLCLQGQLVEKVYDWQEGDPNLVRTTTLSPGGITYMHDSIGFHTIENPSDMTPAVTLHCYHPPYENTSVLTEEGKIEIME